MIGALCIFDTVERLAQHIESLIFASEHPISLKEIKLCLDESFDTKFKMETLEDAIQSLTDRYQAEQFAIELVEINSGYKYMTKGAYHKTIGTYLKQTTSKKLSRAALETLSIIAYRQPVIKSELEQIRGVSCDYSIQKLLEKELVEIHGRSDGPGRPLLYGTSEKFMDYFGLKSISDLPKLKDIEVPENSIGEADVAETVAIPQVVANSSSTEEE